jgi:hypothetical protein
LFVTVKVEPEVPATPPSPIIFTTYVSDFADEEIARLHVSFVDDPPFEIPVQGICWESAEPTRITERILARFCPLTVRVTDSPRSPLVGLKLEIVGDAAPIVNAPGSEVDWPPGFVTWTLAVPASRLLSATLQVIWFEEAETPVATTGIFPGWIRRTVAPLWKLLPLMVRLTVDPVAPLVGDIEVIDGAGPDAAVVAVVAMVGVWTGMDVTETCVILVGYNFSISARGNFSVVLVSRCPQEPSEFFTIVARSYRSLAESYDTISQTPVWAEDVFATTSPAVYFAVACVVGTVVVTFVEDWLEQPARSTHKIRSRHSSSPYTFT